MHELRTRFMYGSGLGVNAYNLASQATGETGRRVDDLERIRDGGVETWTGCWPWSTW